jgi:hypothetical protein
MGFKFNFYLEPNQQREDKFHRPKLILMKKVAGEPALRWYMYMDIAKKRMGEETEN